MSYPQDISQTLALSSPDMAFHLSKVETRRSINYVHLLIKQSLKLKLFNLVNPTGHILLYSA